jgi:hypothetical protein
MANETIDDLSEYVTREVCDALVEDLMQQGTLLDSMQSQIQQMQAFLSTVQSSISQVTFLKRFTI